MRKAISAAHDRNMLPQATANEHPPVPRTSRDIEGLKTIAMICGAGILASLLLLTYGVDLSPGFF
jgi:hypothetical protein